MRLYNIINSKCIKYYYDKVPTWIKPGDFVSDLEEQGLLFKIDKISKNGLIQFIDSRGMPRILPHYYFEKVDN